MKAKTKVMLWHWGWGGGGPRYTFELAQSIKQRPEIELHLSLSQNSKIFPEFDKLQLPGCHARAYDGKASILLESYRLPGLYRRYYRYLMDHNIGVVNCTMTTLWNPAIVPAIKKAGAKYILTLHDAVLHPGEDQYFRRLLLRHEIAHADGIITLTEYVRQKLLQVYKYPREKTSVIPHGAFTHWNSSKGSRTYPTNRPFRLLFFGRIFKYKGLGRLLEAFKVLRTKYPDIELTIAGRGDMSPYLSAVEELGVLVDNRYIAEEEIVNYFQRADLVVLPYLEASQSGVAPMAFTEGLPVVATPVGGLTEQVSHNSNGLIARGVTSEAIAEAVSEIIENPSLYERFSKEAWRFAHEDLSWSALSRKFVEVFCRMSGAG